jgi:hypothetical protein
MACHNFQIQTTERRASMSHNLLPYIFDPKTGSINCTHFEKRGMHFFTSILTSCVETWYKPTEEKQKTAKNIDSIKFFAKDIYFFIQYD